MVFGLGGRKAASVARQRLRRREWRLLKSKQRPHRLPLRDNRNVGQGQLRSGIEMFRPQEKRARRRQNNSIKETVSAAGHGRGEHTAAFEKYGR